MKLKRKLRKALPEEKKERRRLPGGVVKLLQLAGAFLLMFAVYQTACYFAFRPIMVIYWVAAGVLFLVYVVLCRGFSARTLTEDDLRPELPNEEKQAFLAEDTKRKAVAKKVLIWFLALLLTLFIDIVYLFYFL